MAMSQPQVIVFEIIVALYVLWQLSKLFNIAFDRQLGKIPGPFFSRFSGLALKLQVLSGNRTVYIHQLHERYGPFVRIAPNEVAIADITAWQKIHRIGSNFGKGMWYRGQVPQQYNDETAGVFGILDNKKASIRRRMFQTAGTRKIVREWEPRIKELADLTVESVKKELALDGKADLMKWWTLMTSDVLAEIAFGEHFGNVEYGKRSQLVLDIEGIMPFVGLRVELPWISKLIDSLPAALAGSAKANWSRLTTIGEKAVANTKLAYQGGTPTLFSKMLSEENMSKHNIPDNVIIQEASNVIIAGTDTTAMSLTYLTFAVLKDKTIHRKLVEECMACKDNPEWEDLENLRYLNNVINEALRLYPALPGSLPRTVPKGGEDLGQYIIPAGTQVDTQAFTFQRDPRVYEDPLKFNPDRWNNCTPAMEEHFVAFGGPVRYCLGDKIARLEMMHVLFRLFRNCPEIALAPSVTEKSMEIIDFFTIKPRGGHLEVVSSSI